MNNTSSTSSQEKYLREMQSRTVQAIAAESGFVFVFNVISLIGNMVICWAMYRNPRLHTVPNLYILSLAITDVFMAILVMPVTMGVLVTSRWPFGRGFCNVHGTVVLILAFVSSLIIALIALNRYCRVVRPLAYRAWFTVNKSVSMVLVAWGLVICFVLLPVICGWATFSFRPERSGCFMAITSPVANKVITALHLVVFVILPMLIIVVSYFRVFIAVKRHASRVLPSLQANSGGNTMTVEEIRITKVLSAIVFGFLFCWIPVLIIEFVNTTRSEHSLPRWVFLLYTSLWYVSTAINPVIYGALNRSFRYEAARVLPTTTRRVRCLVAEHNV